MAADQFSRTITSDPVERIDRTDRSKTVSPVSPIVGKKVEPKREVSSERERGHRHTPIYSQLVQPEPELWSMVIEAVERFNDHQDVRKSPFAIRIWAQNNGFRLQLIREKCGTLIKQTQIIPFRSVTPEDLNHIVNSLIYERGVVIDLVR